MTEYRAILPTMTTSHARTLDTILSLRLLALGAELREHKANLRDIRAVIESLAERRSALVPSTEIGDVLSRIRLSSQSPRMLVIVATTLERWLA